MPATAAPCPNEALRDGPSANLPDCRAYEQASPVDKNGGDVQGALGLTLASPDGSRILFFTIPGIPGGSGAQDWPVFVASRGGGGWSTAGVLPPPGFGQRARLVAPTPDLDFFFSQASKLDGNGETLLARSSADGSFGTVVPYTEVKDYILVGTSADHSKVFFEATEGTLTPEAIPGRDNLYVWDRESGAVSLVGVLPDSACGSPPCVPPGGSFAGPFEWWQYGESPLGLSLGGARTGYYTQYEPAVSADGSKAYFTAGDSGQIYLRRDPTGPGATSVAVSASQKTNGHDLAGTRPAIFQAASVDGSKAFFTSPEKLTNDATTAPEPLPAAIARANLADGGGKDLGFLPAHAAGIAIGGEFIYWADPKGDTIGRAKLDGSGTPEPSFIAGADNPKGVAVDAEHIYWTNGGDEKEGSGSIGRAKINGELASVDQAFVPGVVEGVDTVNNPRGIDVGGGHIYWVNAGVGSVLSTGFGAVGRAELDGSEADPEITNLANGDIVVDGSKIYFARSNELSSFIRVANLDGSENENLLSIPGATRVPEGLAVVGSHLYWTNYTSSAIGRSDLAGTNQEESFLGGAVRPQGLAIDAEHLIWSASQEIVPNPGNDLYRFDAATAKLTDLTVDAGDENGAEVQGVIGASEDGSYLYFAANGDLDGAGPATSGTCQRRALLDYTGQCNLYLLHGGTSSLVATLDPSGVEDARNWQPSRLGRANDSERTARVSPDGRVLLFRSQRRLTAYDSGGISEFYRYRVGEGLVCVSCDPSGAAPVGPPMLRAQDTRAANLPLRPNGANGGLARNLSVDGNRIFFETPDGLVAADVNGEGGCPPAAHNTFSCDDVYEWEAPGEGSCEEASPAYSPPNGGCLYLLSTGKSQYPSSFGDASASGEDAFFFTREALVPQDEDSLQDVYDASADGGLAAQHQRAPVPCEGEGGCRGAASVPSNFQSPATASFSGAGNPKPTHGRKHRHHKKKKQHHKHRGRAAKPSEGTNR